MTRDEFKILLNNEEEFLKFDAIASKLSSRPDLHAFILLDKLLPGDRDMVSASNHDEIFLSIDVEELVKVIREEQVVELARCGVSYDSSYDCLCMFV